MEGTDDLFNLRVLIVEDSLSFALDLEMMVKEIGYKVVGRADNSGTAFEKIYSLEPDLILMDINIKGKMTGIQIAKKIKHLNIPVLFITSFGQEEYYDKAQDTNLIGYLVKPVEKFTLRSAIEQAFRSKLLSKNEVKSNAFPLNDCLFLKRRGVLCKLAIKEIQFVRADNNHTIIYSPKGRFISALRLSEIQEILAGYHFFKTHRSYLVNLSMIDTLDISEGILTIGTIQIPISRTNRSILMEKLNLI